MAVYAAHERIRACLVDVEFPASKGSLVDAAIRHDSPDIARALLPVASQTCANRAEVMASVTLAGLQPSAATRATVSAEVSRSRSGGRDN